MFDKLRLPALAAVLVAALAVVTLAGGGAAHAQQVADSLPPLADLTIASEYDVSIDRWPAWAVTVKNDTVGAHPGVHFRLVKVRFTISDPVRGDTTRIWTIRDLPPRGSVRGGTRSLRTIPAKTDGPEVAPQRFYAEIIESDPVELPRFRFNNATEHWAIENRREVGGRAGVNRYTNTDIAIDVPSVSDRSPRQGEATNFTVVATALATSIRGVGSQFLDQSLYDVQVEIGLSQGLYFAANQPEAPSGTTFDASTGIWNIGTFNQIRLFLPVAVNLTADSLADLPLEERCLTAKVVSAVPWFALDPFKQQNDTATACLGDVQTAVDPWRRITLFDFYSCVGITTTPCTSANTLELVTVHDEKIMQPE